jgi:hypothetical protein
MYKALKANIKEDLARYSKSYQMLLRLNLLFNAKAITKK